MSAKTLPGTMVEYDYEGQPFTVRDRSGFEYVLIPLFKLRSYDDNSESFRTFHPDDCVGLRTDGGVPVVRHGVGLYSFADDGAPLTSMDPKAV